MNMEQLRRFVEIEEIRKSLESQIEQLKAEAAQLESLILTDFEHDGVDRVTLDGKTIFIERRLWASAKNGDKQALCKALKRARLSEFVQETFNSQSLSALVREWDREGRPIPPSLREVLEVSEVFKLRTRRS